MYKFKEFSEESKEKSILSKVKSSLHKTGKSIEYAATHPKETGIKIGRYIKKNPDQAAVLGASYIVPGAVAARLAKAGKVKQAALAASVAALPIGESYVAGKIAYNKYKERKNK